MDGKRHAVARHGASLRIFFAQQGTRVWFFTRDASVFHATDEHHGAEHFDDNPVMQWEICVYR